MNYGNFFIRDGNFAKGIAGMWGTEGAATKAAMPVMFELKVDANNKVTGAITK